MNWRNYESLPPVGEELFKLAGATGQKLALTPGMWVVIRLKNDDLVRATVCSAPFLTMNSITALIDVWQIWAQAEEKQAVLK